MGELGKDWVYFTGLHFRVRCYRARWLREINSHARTLPLMKGCTRFSLLMCMHVCVQVLVDVCDGLLFCHGGCGGAFGGGILLHRDLKPDNVLLRRDPVTDEIIATLGDFGISKLMPGGGQGADTLETRSIIGTLG
jgi:serine/threonine protein kinase